MGPANGTAPSDAPRNREPGVHRSLTDDHPQVGRRLERVYADYRENREFFRSHQTPEAVALDALNLSDRMTALYVTFTSVTNHTHHVTGHRKLMVGRDGLWWKCARLLEEDPWLFDPGELVGNDRRDELEEEFKRCNLMDGRDAGYWFDVATTLHEEFDDDPRTVLDRYDHDARRIETAIIRDHDFPGLRGQRACPVWLRIVNEEVHSLRNLGAIPLSVDSHLTTVLGALGESAGSGTAGEDDSPPVRDVWRSLCDTNRCPPVILDVPLWLLGSYWEPDGREYVAALR